MSKFSFNNTNKSTGSTRTVNNFGSQFQSQSSYNPSQVGDKQYSFYLDLCKRKRVPSMPRTSFTRETISSVIDALRNQPDMISDRQLEKIAELYASLRELGAEIKYFTQDELFKLSGGREGRASEYISFLMQKQADMNNNQPPSEEQLQVMVPWMLCPDIPFESLTIAREDGSKVIQINRSKPVTMLKSWSSDVNMPEELENRAWQLFTPDEFAEEISRKITKKDANALIDQYRGVFYDWRKTRITQRQIDAVRKMEQRMADLFVPREVELAYDWETGEEIVIKSTDSHVDRGESQYVGYTPIAEVELLQMSVQDASKYLDQLSYELECVKNGKMRLSEDGTNLEYVVNPDNQFFTEKHSNFNERNHTGNATEETKDLVEITAFSDMLFSLEAIAGYKDEQLHELAKPENIINESNELLEYVAEFMYNTIDMKRDMAYVLQRLGGLMTIAENTVVGTCIAQRVTEIVTSELFATNQ